MMPGPGGGHGGNVCADACPPLDCEVANLLKTEAMSGLRITSQLTSTLAQNLVQGLGVVNTSLIQQHGGVADDAAQFAAMQTATRVPVGTT